MRDFTSYPGFPGFNRLLFVFTFLFVNAAWCAIPDFTLSVTKTDEYCTGNGTLSFSVCRSDPLATVGHRVNHLAVTSVPVASRRSITLGRLSAGNYRIVANQTLGTGSKSRQQDISIISHVISLVYH